MTANSQLIFLPSAKRGLGKIVTPSRKSVEVEETANEWFKMQITTKIWHENIPT